MNVSFTIPGNPQGKGRPRFSTRGGFVRAYTPQKTASYEEAVRFELARAMRGKRPAEAPVSLTIVARVPVPGSWSKVRRERALAGEIRPTVKPDLDNIEKIVLDAMNGGAFPDDAYVVSCSKTKIYSENPGVTVTLVELRAEPSHKRKAG